jgi:hypothetical protein
MEWSAGARALSAFVPHLLRPRLSLAAVCALALAGCSIEGRPDASAAQPRGATVVFESIDGPPPGQFQQLVQDLNNEAQSRRLAVLSRESPSAYRVRGYLAAKVVKGQTTISWVWDVFDSDQRRALRIEGEEMASGRHSDAWAAADSAMLGRIASSSMTQLATFLTSPEISPGEPAQSGEAQLVLASTQDSSPEAAGIFRIFQAHADPVAEEAAEGQAAAEPIAGAVPLPRRRPALTTAASARETVTLAASSH